MFRSGCPTIDHLGCDFCVVVCPSCVLTSPTTKPHNETAKFFFLFFWSLSPLSPLSPLSANRNHDDSISYHFHQGQGQGQGPSLSTINLFFIHSCFLKPKRKSSKSYFFLEIFFSLKSQHGEGEKDKKICCCKENDQS